MKKAIDDLIMGGFIPKSLLEKMYQTEAGLLVLGLEAMVYDRQHDDTMRTIFPEKVYVGKCYEYTAEKLGYEPPHAKSDVIIGGAIDLLKALAFQEALKR